MIYPSTSKWTWRLIITTLRTKTSITGISLFWKTILPIKNSLIWEDPSVIYQIGKKLDAPCTKRLLGLTLSKTVKNMLGSEKHLNSNLKRCTHWRLPWSHAYLSVLANNLTTLNLGSNKNAPQLWEAFITTLDLRIHFPNWVSKIESW